MARLTALAAICSAVWLSGCPAPTPTALRTDQSRILFAWLETTCAVGQEAQLQQDLLSNAPALEPGLLAAYRGASPARLAQVDNVAGQRYDALAAYRTRHGRPATPIARAEFVARERARFERGYRAAALGGLGVIGSPEGLKLLRTLAADSSSPDRETAAGILAEYGRK